MGRVEVLRDTNESMYILDQFQGVPNNGYHGMFESMSDSLNVRLGDDEWRRAKADLVVYTGGVDEYYNHCFGRLPYRSLKIVNKRQPKRYWSIVNECRKAISHTRSYDHSHWLNQDVFDSIVSYEYPCEYVEGENDPFYPKLFGEGLELFGKYDQLASRERNAIFVGRLATYSYLDMDLVVRQVMDKLEGVK